MGNLGNNLLLRANFGVDVRFDSLLGRTRETVLAAYAHQDLPLERLVERLQSEGSPDRVPLFQTMFILRDTPLVHNLRLTGTTIDEISVHAGASTLDLTLDVTDGPGAIRGTLEYKTALFDTPTMSALVAQYVDVLNAVARDPAIRVSTLPVRPLVEQNSPQKIEAVLREHPAVQAAKVLLEAGSPARLVAHVVFVPNAVPPTSTELRSFIRSRVADVTSPLLIVTVDDLPSGTVLPEPARATMRSNNSAEYAPPETATELLVIETWRQMLRVERVGLADNFFDLGGDSLLAMNFVARMEKAIGKRLNPGVMILQTARQIAAELDA